MIAFAFGPLWLGINFKSNRTRTIKEQDCISGHHACNVTKETECSTSLSNRHGSTRGPVLPAISRHQMYQDAHYFPSWAVQYGEAIESHNFTKLKALQQGAVWNWNVFLNAHGGRRMPGDLLGEHLLAKQRQIQSFVQLGGAKDIWRPGSSLLDIGSSTAVIDAYLAARYQMAVTAYDIPFTETCKDLMMSPFRVNFFWGAIPEAPCSHDAVSLMSVMHHAAEQTVSLLQQAANISRKHIIIGEDTDVGTNHHALRVHDPSGHFRTDDEWKLLFSQYIPEFRLRSSGPVFTSSSIRGPLTAKKMKFAGAHPFQKYYMLERISPGCRNVA